MAVLNPEHLLDQADRLVLTPPAGPSRQVDLRRAVSAAYYALFHHLLTAAADEVVGRTKRNTPQYALVYRNVSHRSLRDLCVDVGKPVLPKKYTTFAPVAGFGANMAAFAATCVELQDKRHTADYDPGARFRPSDVTTVIGMARSAISRWQLASPGSRKAFLLLLLFDPRSP